MKAPASGHQLTIGSLFSGIGGLESGLERPLAAVTKWQVEIDAHCRSVLERHWPDAQRHEDIRAVDATALERVDIICGGFPCQDISHAGRRAGLEGEHSGLWADFARVVRAIRPLFVVIENSASLLVRGGHRVLSDLAGLGYNAEWEVVPAAAVGAPHLRARCWILAYAVRVRDRASEEALRARWPLAEHRHRWPREPDVARVADGLPNRLDARRLKALGNAAVPRIAAVVAGRIAALLGRSEAARG